MAQFLLAYRLPADYVTGSGDNSAAWMAFFDGLADHLVDIGRPVATSRSIGTCEGTRLGGYSVIEAVDLEAATTLAKDCPALDFGAGVEVGHLASVVDGRVVVED